MSTTPNEIYTNFKAYDFESPKFDNYGWFFSKTKDVSHNLKFKDMERTELENLIEKYHNLSYTSDDVEQGFYYESIATQIEEDIDMLEDEEFVTEEDILNNIKSRILENDIDTLMFPNGEDDL